MTQKRDSSQSKAISSAVAEYIDRVMQEAFERHASDIHLEPFESEFQVRLRVDGVLESLQPPPRSWAEAIASRIKVMAQLDIAQCRLPQDGRIAWTHAGADIELRVSTLPTSFGESIVLRILDRSLTHLCLEHLGLPQDMYASLYAIIQKPHGILIVTGPTGSGKTTTLYSCLQKIASSEVKIITVEDPVEYEIEGVEQVHVHEEIGLGFSQLLRSLLRQDPDHILIGEIRDQPTAQMAIQAALTGHLVLSSLHTNDAPGAVLRLLDMGLEPFLIAAALEAVLAQRLVRKICPHCKIHGPVAPDLLEAIGLNPASTPIFFEAQGCPACHHTGYHARTGIFELMQVNATLKNWISQPDTTLPLRQLAIQLGMLPLRQQALRLGLEGVTTLEEILKYT